MTITYATKIEELLNSDGDRVVVQEGESFDITGTVTDVDGTTLTSSALASITLTLFDEDTGDVINSQDGTDISGSVSAGGTLTLKLDPSDNAINNTSLPERALEAHIARIKWTWVDDDLETRTGLAEYRFRVQKLVVAA